jgi:Tol biopolymer transport system component
MFNEPFDCPQKPFGGEEDYVWNPDGKHLVYVAKKKSGTDYALSTNADLYEYDAETGVTRNLTEENKGYDVAPAFNDQGNMAWLRMKREGYEADKQDIMVSDGKTKLNLTGKRDDIHAESFSWSKNGNVIYFIAPVNGTLQLFTVNNPLVSKSDPVITQVTKGDFDVSGIVGEVDNTLFVARNDMNHATELYTLNPATGSMKQFTHVNDAAMGNLSPGL